MEASPVPTIPATRGLPIARVRDVFSPEEVEQRLRRLKAQGNDREQAALCQTYERMLERGPQRFAVKPSGVPDLEPLYEQLPNFSAVLDDVRRHVALAQVSGDTIN